MHKKNTWLVAAVVVILVVGAAVLLARRPSVMPAAGSVEGHDMATMAEDRAPQRTASVAVSDVVEIRMNSFVEMVDGKPKPQFDPAAITVKKGDRVRIVVTVTKGTHDFHIDEYGIHQATPLDTPTTIEFVADKAGKFEYYCNMPGHRAAGHWGTLTVTE